jgi:dolichyl-phosphate-mannose--protein O-mannosyl transferase
MYYMHSRLALLDIFPAGFAALGFAFALHHRRYGRYVGGIFFGAAIASKFYALFLLPVFLLVCFLKTPAPLFPKDPSVYGTYEQSREPWHPFSPLVRRISIAMVAGLLIPFVTYTVTYAPFLLEWTRSHDALFAVAQFFRVHVHAFTWDFAANATHAYQSHPVLWLLLARPVYYYVYTFAGNETGYPDTLDIDGGELGKMYSIGNPWLWWTATAFLIIVPLRVLWRFARDKAFIYLRWDFLQYAAFYPFHITRDFAFLLVGLVFWFGYLPFFLIQRQMLFVYYLTMAVPYFAIIAAGVVSERWERGGFDQILAVFYVIMIVVFAAVYYPLVSGYPTEPSQLEWIQELVPWMSQ